MSTSENKTDATYVLGHPTGEERRLQRLDQLQAASTRDLFRKAGIAPGMKVLDVGSGAGDVALLLAELIGPEGSIVGVDVSASVLETARARLQAVGFEQATFLVGDIRSVVLENDFDAVVGRNILMYLANPAEVLRLCANHLRPGGLIAFQEIEWSITERVVTMSSVPPLAQQAASWIIQGFCQAGTEMHMGFKFPQFFLDAGLPLPSMSLDSMVGTEADWVGYDFLKDVLRDILPKLHEYGILDKQVDAASFVARLREEIRQRHAFFPLFFLSGAWAKKEDSLCQVVKTRQEPLA
jgi:ubiquinone/menaquinone biosynthesis C-methylase UbiE